MYTDDRGKLQEFIEASKSKGASDEFLAAFLTRRGWPADDVYSALGKYWEGLTGIGIPERTGGGESARDAFLYLLSFATLATWATALGSMLFDFIDHWLPDPISRSHVFDMRSSVTWQMASLAVAFPIYLLVTRLTVREAINYPDRLQSGVRKWLTYIALLGTAGTMICDLIWSLDYLLMGEITMRFVLKAATVMVIAGAIFFYYLDSLKWKREVRVSRRRFGNVAFAAVAALAVVATFCIGLVLAGTPSQQRQVEADRHRIEDLRSIAGVIAIWHNRARLDNPNATIPPTLTLLVQNRNIALDRITDPETHAVYEYRPRANSTYELCANFESTFTGDHPNGMPYSDFWHYGKGRTCFAINASEAVPF